MGLRVFKEIQGWEDLQGEKTSQIQSQEQIEAFQIRGQVTD